MSSKNLSNLSRLLLIVDHLHPTPHSVANYGWDFEKQQLFPEPSMDSLARFVCYDIREQVVTDDKQPLSGQLLTSAQIVMESVEELKELANRLSQHAADRILHEFCRWFIETNRPFLYTGLLDSWLDVQSSELVRSERGAVFDQLRARMTWQHVSSDLSINREHIIRLASELEVAFSTIGAWMDEKAEPAVEVTAPEPAPAQSSVA